MTTGSPGLPGNAVAIRPVFRGTPPGPDYAGLNRVELGQRSALPIFIINVSQTMQSFIQKSVEVFAILIRISPGQIY